MGENFFRCAICPHNCTLKSGKSGICGTRLYDENESRLLIPFSGYVTALAEDPIEKKPLYHYRPGSSIVSAGFAGCNLHCPFCQNWQISQIAKEHPGKSSYPEYGSFPTGKKMKPDELITAAEKTGAIAYTYSEPLVHYEYLVECMEEARGRNVKNILVTNGCINNLPARKILALTDAANIDLKCFSESTYSNVLGGDLKTVCSFITTALSAGVHVELTTLIVPGLNDSDEEISKCIEFILGLGRDKNIPWHLSAYHPDYKWKQPATSPAKLIKLAEKAQEHLPYVYTGNITGGKCDTFCPHCGKPLVKRSGYSIETAGLVLNEINNTNQYSCKHCGIQVPFQY